MKLKNLIEVADKNTTIMLCGITSEGKEIGFDFKNNIWLMDNRFSPDRLLSVGEFEHYKMYRELKEHQIEDFSIFNGNHIHQFKNVNIYHGKICKIKVYISTGKSDIRKSIEARVNVLAEKRMEGKKPPKPQTYRRKGGWSFVKKSDPIVEGESNKVKGGDLDN